MEKDYGRLVRRAAMCATGCATVLIFIKTIAWWMTGSVSLLASVVDSFVDMGASLTNLLVIRYALQPPDDDHTFGHGKAESLAALAQCMFISGSALFLVLSGIENFSNPKALETPVIGVVVIVLSLFVTIALLSFQTWVVNKTQSQAIKADRIHYQSDVFMNSAVLVALLLSWYGIHRADSIFAIIIGIYIFYSAWTMGREAIQALLDRALPDDEQALIIETIKNWPNVEGAHDLKTRQSGPVKFIQFHIELKDELPLVKAHAISDGLEQELLRIFPAAEVIIHQDPCSVIPLEQERSKERWLF